MPGVKKLQKLGFLQCTQDVNIADTNYTMEAVDKNVFITSISTSRSVTLPPVEEGVGGIYTLWIASGSFTWTVTANSSSDRFKGNILDNSVFVASVALGSALDYIVLYSTGRAWIVLAKEVS